MQAENITKYSCNLQKKVETIFQQGKRLHAALCLLSVSFIQDNNDVAMKYHLTFEGGMEQIRSGPPEEISTKALTPEKVLSKLHFLKKISGGQVRK